MCSLRILTDAASLKGRDESCEPPDLPSPAQSTGSDIDSLFDEPGPHAENIFEDLQLANSSSSAYLEPPPPTNLKPARRTAPCVPGLYFDPRITLPDELAETVLQTCMSTYFRDEHVNQVMLFERVISSQIPPSASTDPGNTDVPGGSASTRLPPFLIDLLYTLSRCMRDVLPSKTHELLFPAPNSPPQARQVIINFYRPGEGITPHVDLLDRFGDGIIGVSLGSGCVMQFAKVKPRDASSPADGREEMDRSTESEKVAVFLPHGSIYVMSEEARYDWTHGIDGRKEDWVQDRIDSDQGRWVMRSIRVSITFRWLLPGADVVGGLPDAVSTY